MSPSLHSTSSCIPGKLLTLCAVCSSLHGQQELAHLLSTSCAREMLQGYKMFSTLTPTGLLSVTGLCTYRFLLPAQRLWSPVLNCCWAWRWKRRDDSGEGCFRGEQERNLGRTVAVCCCSTFAQLPLRRAVGEVRPSWMGRVEGSLLYPSKCSA